MMYIILREGVYINNVLGVFSYLKEVIKAAEKATALESDDYHYITVYEIPINKLVNVGKDGLENSLTKITESKKI